MEANAKRRSRSAPVAQQNPEKIRWLRRFNKCLWQIHRFSLTLFCWLLFLNGLSCVLLPSSDREKLAEELRKKVASNTTTSSEEEDLTRQILALFDYVDDLDNQTVTILNGSRQMEKIANETNKVDMEFNLDLASDSFESSNSTDIQLKLNATEESKDYASMFEMTTMTPNRTNASSTIDTVPVFALNASKEYSANFSLSDSNITTSTLTNTVETTLEIVKSTSEMESYTTTEQPRTSSRSLESDLPLETQTTPVITDSPERFVNTTKENDETSKFLNGIVHSERTSESSVELSSSDEATATTTTPAPTTTATLAITTTGNSNEERSISSVMEPKGTEGGIAADDQLARNNLVEEEVGAASGNMNINAALLELQRQIQLKTEHSAGIDAAELRQYRDNLANMLANVEGMISKTAAMPVQTLESSKPKRLIAISSSLPNWESALFLSRKNALSASLDENIRKSPPHKTTPETTLASTTTTMEGTTVPSVINEHSFPESQAKEAKSDSSGSAESAEQYNPRKTGFFRAESIASKALPFDPVRNHSLEQCKHLSQAELVNELKQKGTFNPDLMAWDVSGIFRFLDRSIVDQYERQSKPPKSSEQAVRRNVEALELLLSELNLQCEVRTPQVLSRLSNLTMAEPKRSIISPTLRSQEDARHKRNPFLADQLLHSFNDSLRRDSPPPQIRYKRKKQKLIGDVHVVPFGCDKRGSVEDGYLRLCGACQAIRKLPDEFFPPFLNEVMCDEDQACLYFYNYAHGKCKQKHMNFVVLRNTGTQLCQVWEKFNLNVRVSCECFVDEMSFFGKYV